jgi:hypothetical protein
MIDWISVEKEKQPFNKRVLIKVKDCGIFFAELFKPIVGKNYCKLFEDSADKYNYGFCDGDSVTHWAEINEPESDK